MRYKKILLVNPPYQGNRVKVVFTAGLGYIAQSLETAGIEHDVLDMSLGYTYKELHNKILQFQPDLIGFSVMTYKFKQTYSIIEKIKKEFPAKYIVAGGPHISLFREKVLSECPHLDYGVVLEGEETIIELCTGKSVDLIKGLIFRKDAEVVFNGERSFIANLDGIPFPRYNKFELENSLNKKMSALPIVSSRGCPFDCIYCPVQFSIGQAFRMRSPENIMEELRYWYKKGYKRFSFADDNFTLKKERIYKLCELLKKSDLQGLELNCDNGIRADKVDKDLLKIMKEVGFTRIAFGVEAGNDKVLKMLRKSENINTITTRIKEACELGYDVRLFFLVGSPGETWEDLKDSFDIALNYPVGAVFFYNIIPFPRTKLFDWIKENGRLLKDPDDYLNNYPILDNDPVFETPQMPKALRKKALKAAFKIMRSTMRRNWEKRLAKFGIIGRLAAFVYTSKIMQDIMLRNKFLSKLIYKVAGYFFK